MTQQQSHDEWRQERLEDQVSTSNIIARRGLWRDIYLHYIAADDGHVAAKRLARRALLDYDKAFGIKP